MRSAQGVEKEIESPEGKGATPKRPQRILAFGSRLPRPGKKGCLASTGGIGKSLIPLMSATTLHNPRFGSRKREGEAGLAEALGEPAAARRNAFRPPRQSKALGGGWGRARPFSKKVRPFPHFSHLPLPQLVRISPMTSLSCWSISRALSGFCSAMLLSWKGSALRSYNSS